jgi:putative membrane protein insertion efficiency factor
MKPAVMAVVDRSVIRAFICPSTDARGSIAIIAVSATPNPAMSHPTRNPASDERPARSPFVLLLLGLIHAYRFVLSPLLGPRCRYLPTCSEYALEALNRHGLWRGARLAVRRILRCHPWGGSGHDPVPPTP